MAPEELAVTVLGAGRIGWAVALLLSQAGGYAVRVADRNAQRLQPLVHAGCEAMAVDVTSEAGLQQALEGRYAVLNALPFHRTLAVAEVAARLGVHYFDLTEDLRSAHAIQALGQQARCVLMPQCGLAPGFIGIVGNDLAQRFDTLHDLHLRVGALPRFPVNALRYNLTWSTEGLINQYCQPCEAVVDGRLTEVAPLDGYERFALDGVEYEAFYTSGGLGNLARAWQGRVGQADYKSIRYPGHRDIMCLLLQELRLREHPQLLKDILERAIPSTEQDVVVILATASGMRGGRLLQESYSARILGVELAGHRLNAIQRTTASSLCAALDLVRDGTLPQAGFIGQEQVPLAAFLANRFGSTYPAASLEVVAL